MSILGWISDAALLMLLIVVSVIVYMAFKRDITYYVEPSDLDPNFTRQTAEILRTSKLDKTHNVRQVFTTDADITIQLIPRAKMDTSKPAEYYPGTNKRIRFSYTWQNPKPHIAIDSVNWLEGVPESGLTLQEYRAYVIRHEFMHALGYNHQPCNKATASNGVCPVLFQATRGCPAGFKCGSEITPVDYREKIPGSYF